MTITASPQDRLGDHVVLTVTAPTYWVLLHHHGREVQVDVLRLIKFAERFGGEPEEYRYDNTRFSWIEEVALREVGWIVVLSSGSPWPTRKLNDACEEWKRIKAM